MGKNRGRTTKSAHSIASAKPAAKALIKELKNNFENWPTEERRKKLSKLLAIDGIAIRSLAEDTGIPDSTLRYYTPRARQVEVPRKQAPLAKPTVQKVAATHPPDVEQETSPKMAPSRPTRGRVVLPPRPVHTVQSGVGETDPRELAKLILEFLQRRGNNLGFQYPKDLPLVLSYVSMSDLPDSPGQAVGSIPIGDDRSDFFDKMSLGASDSYRLYRLSVGLRNLMKQLGGSRSTWASAFIELRRMNQELLGGLAQKQEASPSGVEPVRRPIEFYVVVPGWRKRK